MYLVQAVHALPDTGKLSRGGALPWGPRPLRLRDGRLPYRDFMEFYNGYTVRQFLPTQNHQIIPVYGGMINRLTNFALCVTRRQGGGVGRLGPRRNDA